MLSFPIQTKAAEFLPIRFNFYSGEESAPDTITPFRDVDSTYYLFVPADCDLKQITPFFDPTLSVSIDEEALVSGMPCPLPTEPEHTYTILCNRSSYKLVLLQAQKAPAIFLSTESGSLESIHADRNFSEPGIVAVYENGRQTLCVNYNKLKLRGNGSSTYPKRSYNLSFFQKFSLFGMPKAKKWALIANYTDNTRIRNTLGLTLGRESAIPYTSESALADVYINGSYQGLYQITESVELGVGRVELPNLDKANKRANLGTDISELRQTTLRLPSGIEIKGFPIENDPEDISGAYLIELQTYSRYTSARSGFVSSLSQPVTLKAPKYPSMKEVEYIATLFDEAEEALRSSTGYNRLGKHYTEYIDLDSFARAYILEEFSMDTDSVLMSTFFFKPSGEDRFYACCAWDFDHAFFNKYGCSPRYGFDMGDPTKWYCRNSYHLGAYRPSGDDVPTAFHILFRTEEFRRVVRDVWAEIRPAYVSAIDSLDSLCAATRASVVMESYLWPVQLINCSYEKRVSSVSSYAEQLIADCRTRLSLLDKGFSENVALLYYDVNGGKGFNIATEFLFLGENATIECTGFSFPKTFVFNTRPDGSGTTYYVGDTITLTEPVMTLYAMWGR